MNFASVNNTRIAYELTGAGFPLVLIHAGLGDSRMWDEQFPVFAQSYKTLRYDVRGFGRTPSPAGKYADHEDLRALLDFLEIEQAHLLGISNGGKIALNFALTYPDKVEKLIVVGTSVEGEPPAEEIKQGWAKIEALETAAIEKAEANSTAPDFSAAIEATLDMWVAGPHRTLRDVPVSISQLLTEMLQTLYNIPEEDDAGEAHPLSPPAYERLTDISAPTLNLVGELDLPAKLSLSNKLLKVIPNCRQMLIPNTAHLPQLEQPNLFNQSVLDFLAA